MKHLLAVLLYCQHFFITANVLSINNPGLLLLLSLLPATNRLVIYLGVYQHFNTQFQSSKVPLASCTTRRLIYVHAHLKAIHLLLADSLTNHHVALTVKALMKLFHMLSSTDCCPFRNTGFGFTLSAHSFFTILPHSRIFDAISFSETLCFTMSQLLFTTTTPGSSCAPAP